MLMELVLGLELSPNILYTLKVILKELNKNINQIIITLLVLLKRKINIINLDKYRDLYIDKEPIENPNGISIYATENKNGYEPVHENVKNDASEKEEIK